MTDAGTEPAASKEELAADAKFSETELAVPDSPSGAKSTVVSDASGGDNADRDASPGLPPNPIATRHRVYLPTRPPNSPGNRSL